jgi:hypothetical protein
MGKIYNNEDFKGNSYKDRMNMAKALSVNCGLSSLHWIIVE